MKFRKLNSAYVIRLEKGEKIFEKLKEFCAKNEVKSAYFVGIGAAEEAEIGIYVPSKKRYHFEHFKQPLEIANLTGNITTMNNEIYIHCHAVFSDINLDAVAGHLKEATISATCEIFLVNLDATINRKYDDLIGLNLMELQ